MVNCVVFECGSLVSCIKDEGCVVQYKFDGVVCDDGNLCTIIDVCNEEYVCVGQIGVSCDDVNLCTIDGCDFEIGCTYILVEDLNGLLCFVLGVCVVVGQCVDGICVVVGNVDCDDFNLCIDDECDQIIGCINIFNVQLCNDGDLCMVIDMCSDGVCVGSGVIETLSFNCLQSNVIDDGKCCCFLEDFMGEYFSGYVFDLGVVYKNVIIECCLLLGFSFGCKDMVYFDMLEDG